MTGKQENKEKHDMSMFSAPATASGIDLQALNGSLLLVHVHDVRQGITTSYGPTDAVQADVAVLDGPQAGETYDDTLIFPKVLQSQLRSKVGEKVLGRLGQGVAKPGQSAPWVLSAATEADVELATKWLTRTAQPAAAVPQQQDDTPPWARG